MSNDRKRDVGDNDSQGTSSTSNMWYDGKVDPHHLDISKLNFPSGQYFLGRYKIVDRLPLDDDSNGVMYLAVSKTHEVVLRVNFMQRKDLQQLGNEISFLQKAEAGGVQHWFGSLLEYQVLHMSRPDGIAFYASIYRGGPSLTSCISLCGGSLSLQSVARLGCDILTMVDLVYRSSFRLRNLTPAHFTFDHRSHHLFFSHFTDIVKWKTRPIWRFRKAHLPFEPDADADETFHFQTWIGPLEYAPTVYHLNPKNHLMTSLAATESVIYLLSELLVGKLPWANQTISKASALKVHHADQSIADSLINTLPHPLRMMWSLILLWNKEGKETANITKLIQILQQVYISDHATSEDFLFEWERELEEESVEEMLLQKRHEIVDGRSECATLQAIYDALLMAAEEEPCEEKAEEPLVQERESGDSLVQRELSPINSEVDVEEEWTMEEELPVEKTWANAVMEEEMKMQTRVEVRNRSRAAGGADRWKLLDTIVHY